MSIRKYIAYLRTVETGSITQAANELGYTQSAVSKMISDLEQDWQALNAQPLRHRDLLRRHGAPAHDPRDRQGL